MNFFFFYKKQVSFKIKKRRDTKGYEGIRRDTKKYEGIRNDTKGYEEIRRCFL